MKEEKWPRLTVTLRRPMPDIYLCQKCGGKDELQRWQECDDKDRPEYALVILCRECSDAIIKPHPRLYRCLHKFQPWPGAMSICNDCRMREGLWCSNPDAKINGGAGLTLIGPAPMRGFIDGPGVHGIAEIYPGPVTSCDGKKT
jgi:hypothetical protein